MIDSWETFCLFLEIAALAVCPNVGEPVPEQFVVGMLAQWPADYRELGLTLAMRETYHSIDAETGAPTVYPWSTPNYGRFANGAVGDGGRALGLLQIHVWRGPWADYCNWNGDPFDPWQNLELGFCLVIYDEERDQLGAQWNIDARSNAKPRGRVPTRSQTGENAHLP